MNDVVERDGNEKASDNSSLLKRIIPNYELTEEDFYPPEDKRIYKSRVKDIVDGDNFEDYAKWFYDNYEDELFDN